MSFNDAVDILCEAIDRAEAERAGDEHVDVGVSIALPPGKYQLMETGREIASLDAVTLTHMVRHHPDYRAMLDNLTATQRRCNELLDETRVLRRALELACNAIAYGDAPSSDEETYIAKAREVTTEPQTREDMPTNESIDDQIWESDSIPLSEEDE